MIVDPSSSPTAIAHVSELLRDGHVVAIPTETVYGLAANVSRADAIARVFELKGRPASHPLIAHGHNVQSFERYAAVSDDVRCLADAFWPGPLTIVVEALPTLNTLATGGRSTVGIRVPNHAVTLSILAVLDDLVAAPSANRFGRVSPTAATHVQDEFGPELVVVDGGQSNIGVESTIVDLSTAQPRLLRQGAIDVVQLQEVLGSDIDVPDASSIVNTVSGTMLAHYAPRAKVVIVEPAELPNLQLKEHDRYWAPDYLGRTSAERARNLYRELRRLDADSVACAWVVLPPETDALDCAVRDRLSRAAAAE